MQKIQNLQDCGGVLQQVLVELREQECLMRAKKEWLKANQHACNLRIIYSLARVQIDQGEQAVQRKISQQLAQQRENLSNAIANNKISLYNYTKITVNFLESLLKLFNN